MRLINAFDRDSGELGFVLDHPSKLAIGPLVKALVHLRSVVDPITDAANIADCNRRDTSLKEHLHDLPRQFVKEVRDLVVDVLKLFVLRLDELLPAIRAALFAVDLRVELSLETVLVVTQSAKFAAVDREDVIAREDSGELLLSEINSSYLVSGGSVNRFSVILRSDDKTTRGLSDLDGPRLFVDGPINQNRIFSALCGQAKNAVVSERDSLVGPAKDIVLFITTLRRVAPPVVVVPGANRFVELLRDFLSRLRRQYIMAFAVPLTHRRLREPVVLPIYCTPVPLADRVPQVRRRTRQPFELLGALDMKLAGQVHASGLIFDVLLNDLLAYFTSRTDKVRTSPKGRESMQMVKLVPKNMSTGSLESVNHLVRSMTSIRLSKQMNMVGPDRQRIDLPLVLFGYFMKHLFQAICHRFFEHTRSSFHSPHEVILHRAGGAGGLCGMAFCRLASLNR
jgi:hypothetical protein